MKSPGRKTPAVSAAAAAATATVISAAGELIAATSTLIPPIFKSSTLLPLPPANWNLFRRLCLFLLSLLLHFFKHLISRLFPTPPPISRAADYIAASSSPVRALAHTLAMVSSTPVSSRKYYLVRSLSDRLLDENLSSSPAGDLRAVNSSALSDAFARTIRRLESAVRAPMGGPMDLVVRAISGGVRRIGVAAEEGGGVGSTAAEKLAAEMLWLAQKMAECGAAGEAVVRWASASGLARSALSAETRIQIAFVKVSVFLFRQAHEMQLEWRREDRNEDDEHVVLVSKCCVLMLRTWLPLLCRTSNGAEAPILSGAEREEMVRVLEEVIEKAEWEQQEEVLGLWLLHFASCPDSDWPNLESCYTKWYARSRELFLQRSIVFEHRNPTLR